MGALSYMAAGLAGGLGKGIAGYGADLMRQAEQRDLMAERQADRMELLSARQAAAGGAGGGRVNQSPAQKLYEFGQLMLSGGARGALMAGGMTPGAAADASSMMQGNEPTRTIDLPADRFTNPDRQDAAAAGPSSAQAPKYSDGQAAQLMEASRIALRRAMGLMEPAAADDIAKAEGTEQTNELIRRYAGGDTQAGRGALAAAGKTTFSAAGDELTGAVPKGSVAESTVRKNDADAAQSRAAAGASGALAKKYGAEVDKIKAEVDSPGKGASEERLTTILEKLNTYAKDSNLSPEELAEVNSLRQRITRQLSSFVDGKAGGRPAAASAPGGKVDAATALSQAKAAIARGAPRDKVIERLRSLGVDPKGL